MEIFTPKAARRSTRLRVQIPVMVTSLDRMRPFSEKCMALVVSCQGCGLRSSMELPVGTPIILSDLPDGGSVTARVASCVPLGSDSGHFLVGAALYTHGNVWSIADPPADWDAVPHPAADEVNAGAGSTFPHRTANKQVWPYNVFAETNEVPLAKK